MRHIWTCPPNPTPSSEPHLAAVKHHHAVWVLGAGGRGGRVHFRSHDDGFGLVPKRILTEDEVGEVLWKTGGLQDLNL